MRLNPGVDYYEQKYQEQMLKKLQKKAQAIALELLPRSTSVRRKIFLSLFEQIELNVIHLSYEKYTLLPSISCLLPPALPSRTNFVIASNSP